VAVFPRGEGIAVAVTLAAGRNALAVVGQAAAAFQAARSQAEEECRVDESYVGAAAADQTLAAPGAAGDEWAAAAPEVECQAVAEQRAVEVAGRGRRWDGTPSAQHISQIVGGRSRSVGAAAVAVVAAVAARRPERYWAGCCGHRQLQQDKNVLIMNCIVTVRELHTITIKGKLWRNSTNRDT